MGQLHMAQKRVLMVESKSTFHEKNDELISKFLSPVLTKIRAFKVTGKLHHRTIYNNDLDDVFGTADTIISAFPKTYLLGANVYGNAGILVSAILKTSSRSLLLMVR